MCNRYSNNYIEKIRGLEIGLYARIGLANTQGWGHVEGWICKRRCTEDPAPARRPR